MEFLKTKVNTCIYIVVLLFLGSTATCHRETFNGTCEQNEVMLMNAARYGRMEIGRCAKRNLGYIGCVVDVLTFMDTRCSGRTSCSVDVGTDALYNTHPCPEDTKSYLETSYSCLPGR